MSEAAPVVDYIHAVDRELCLSFVNKVSRRLGEATNDHLTGYTGLVAWAESAGALNTATAALLCEQAAEKPAQAAAVFRRAVSLREALYRIFMQAIEGAPPQDEDLKRFNAELAAALSNLRVQPGHDCWEGVWAECSHDPAQMLWPVARSAAELLTSNEVDRVRQCASETCGWLFIDRSRNRSRRWCDMSECGNVAKVRRYRQRQKVD